jgi:CxxC-x17-CxxC domain-containing protein
MTYEDRTLVCSHCKNEFVFSAGEQAFYAEKGLTSDPKRCKPCREARRRAKQPKKDGIYRSPAFENSAPAHQKVRGRRTGGRSGRSDYRSPGLNDRRPRRDDYRSPAFRDIDVIKPEQEYRSPGFREYDDIKPEEEYRSPGFQEIQGLNVNEEYRAPGFQGQAKKYVDATPMFAIVCASCGIDAMVPVFPDEREETYCPECYKQRKAALAAAAAEERVEERAAAEQAASAVSPSADADDTSPDADAGDTTDAAPAADVSTAIEADDAPAQSSEDDRAAE